MKEERKIRNDTRNQVQKQQRKTKDKETIKQETTKVRLLYDPKPYRAMDVKGAQTTR